MHVIFVIINGKLSQLQILLTEMEIERSVRIKTHTNELVPDNQHHSYDDANHYKTDEQHSQITGALGLGSKCGGGGGGGTKNEHELHICKMLEWTLDLAEKSKTHDNRIIILNKVRNEKLPQFNNSNNNAKLRQRETFRFFFFFRFCCFAVQTSSLSASNISSFYILVAEPHNHIAIVTIQASSRSHSLSHTHSL